MIHARRGRRRLTVTVLGVFVVLVVFAVRLVDFQVVRAAEISAEANAHRTVEVTTYGSRGAILAEDGTVLAQSVDRFDITASPRHVDLSTTWMMKDDVLTEVPTTEAIAAIAELSGGDAAEILAAITADPDSDFTYLVKQVTLEVYQAVDALQIPWVYFELNPSRVYPNGALAGNLVGFLGTDGALAGTELNEDSCLASTDGTTTYESSADGIRLPGSTVVTKEPADGGSITLTIDSDLQWYAQQVLDREARDLGADWATAMVVRVDDGHIMADADWPSIDPNDLDSVSADDAGARSFTAPFEPGSIMKSATVASLLDAGVVTAGEHWTVGDYYTKGLPEGAFVKDAWWHGDVRWTTAGILVESSNVGISKMETRLSKKERRQYLLNFGFDRRTAVDFLGESSGYVLPLDELDPISNVNQGFGQGISVTSAQIASMYQTLGNGGVRMPLTLVEGCTAPDGTVTELPDTEGTRVVSESAADTTVAILENVVSNGPLTDYMSFPGYRVAAKTGTAEVAEGGIYTDDRIISIAGLVPAEDPQYAVVVTFAKPDTIKYSAGAAPGFASIMKQVIKTFRIAPSSGKAPNIPLTW